MKIRTQAGLLIASITLVPVLVAIVFRYSDMLDQRKLENSVYKEFVQIYSALKTNDWSYFSIGSYLSKTYLVSAIAISSDDKVLFSTDMKIEKGRSFSPLFWKTLEGNGNSSYITTVLSLSEIEAMFSSVLKNLPGYGKYNLHIVVKMPIDSMLLPTNRTRGVAAIGMLIFLVSIIGFSIVLIIKISRTMTTLSKATKAFASGDYKREIPVKGNDEICSLIQAFNKMSREIQDNAARKSHLIMGMSHDFKTPLALIQGYTEVIDKQTDEKKTDIHKYLGIISSKTELLETMIEDLLEFVSLDEGEWPYAFAKINFAGWMNAFILRTRNDVQLLGKKVTGSINIPQNTIVEMDERLAERALNNLVHNAVRYTGSDGTVHITVMQKNGMIQIQVFDNGPGIAEKDLPYIFDAFYRGTPSRQTPGMGLGLSVVKSVMDAHRWTITAGNIAPHGAVFTITVPVSR